MVSFGFGAVGACQNRRNIMDRRNIMVSFGFGAVGTCVALRNGFNAANIVSAISSFALGTIIGRKVIHIKKSEAKERHYIDYFPITAIVTTFFTAAISHKLVNVFSLRNATLVQIGIGLIASRLAAQDAAQEIFPHSIKILLGASGCSWLYSGLSLASVIGLKYFGVTSIPEGAKSSVFVTTMLATAASVVASAVFTAFFIKGPPPQTEET